MPAIWREATATAIAVLGDHAPLSRDLGPVTESLRSWTPTDAERDGLVAKLREFIPVDATDRRIIYYLLSCIPGTPESSKPWERTAEVPRPTRLTVALVILGIVVLLDVGVGLWVLMGGAEGSTTFGVWSLIGAAFIATCLAGMLRGIQLGRQVQLVFQVLAVIGSGLILVRASDSLTAVVGVLQLVQSGFLVWALASRSTRVYLDDRRRVLLERASARRAAATSAA